MSPKASKEEIREMEFVFYNESKIRRLIRESRLDRPRCDLLVKPSNRCIGDPVSSQVLRNLMPVKFIFIDDRPFFQPEQWMKIVDESYRIASEKISQVARLRYSHTPLNQILSTLRISSGIYYFRINEFRSLAISLRKKIQKIEKNT